MGYYHKMNDTDDSRYSYEEIYELTRLPPHEASRAPTNRPPSDFPNGSHHLWVQEVVGEVAMWGSYQEISALDMTVLSRRDDDMRSGWWTWMSDSPRERLSMLAAVHELVGLEKTELCNLGGLEHIVVGGLGLGLFIETARIHLPLVTFTVIEKSQFVIDMWERAVERMDRPPPVTVVKGDIDVFLCDKDFMLEADAVYLDTWGLSPECLAQANNSVQLAEANTAPGTPILAWAREYMIEQRMSKDSISTLVDRLRLQMILYACPLCRGEPTGFDLDAMMKKLPVEALCLERWADPTPFGDEAREAQLRAALETCTISG